MSTRSPISRVRSALRAPATRCGTGRHREAGGVAGQLQQDKDAYWAEIVDIQRQVATAWLLNAQGKSAEALNAMRRLLMRRTRRKSPSSRRGRSPLRGSSTGPCCSKGVWRPKRLPRSRHLRKEPNRFGAAIGAAQAAEKAGDTQRRASITRRSLTWREMATLPGRSSRPRGRSWPRISKVRRAPCA